MIEALKTIAARNEQSDRMPDAEEDHMDADNLLLAYIDDADVTAAFEAIHKWYA